MEINNAGNMMAKLARQRDIDLSIERDGVVEHLHCHGYRVGLSKRDQVVKLIFHTNKGNIKITLDTRQEWIA